MKRNIKHFLFAGLFFIATRVEAQNENIHLVCPFEHGSGREPREAYTWDQPDKKIIMISHIDTIIRSSITGKVSNVDLAEDNLYDIVIYSGNFYFWYYGVTKPIVSRGQNVKAGQAIGIYKLGTELEFRMFKDEDPMDPRNLLECKVPKAE